MCLKKQENEAKSMRTENLEKDETEMDRGESEEINDWGQTDTECDNFEVMEVPPTIDNRSNSIHELKKNPEKKTESKTGDQTYRRATNAN